MSIDDSRQRNWSDADVVHRQNDRRNSYRGNYGNGSQRKQRNQGFESRNRFDRDNQRFNNNNGKYQYRNRRPRENFSRENQRHGGRLNVLKVLDDQSQSIKNIPIRLLAICMSAAELLCVPILLNETFTKALWDTGAEKSFICENVYKKYFFYKQVRKSSAQVVTAQGAKNRNVGEVELLLDEGNLNVDNSKTVVADISSGNIVESIAGENVDCAVIRDLVLSSRGQLIEEQRRETELGNIQVDTLKILRIARLMRQSVRAGLAIFD
ncbi:uncharacterized protein TNCV_4956221 [Trichonephila clavipes]|nr:uncharacterized protein TNCV_4956221 [Trichonephila clavipes]